MKKKIKKLGDVGKLIAFVEKIFFGGGLFTKEASLSFITDLLDFFGRLEASKKSVINDNDASLVNKLPKKI